MKFFEYFVLAVALFNLLSISANAAVPVPPGHYLSQTLSNFNADVQLFLPLNSSTPVPGVVIVSQRTGPLSWSEVCTAQVNVTWSGRAISASGDLRAVAITTFTERPSSIPQNSLSFLGPFPTNTTAATNGSFPICTDDATYEFDLLEFIGPITSNALNFDGTFMALGHSNDTMAMVNIYTIDAPAYDLVFTYQSTLSPLIGYTPYVTSLSFSSTPAFLFSREVLLASNGSSIEILGYLNLANATAGFTTIATTPIDLYTPNTINYGVELAVARNAGLISITMAQSKRYPLRMWFNSNPGAPGAIWKPV